MQRPRLRLALLSLSCLALTGFQEPLLTPTQPPAQKPGQGRQEPLEALRQRAEKAFQQGDYQSAATAYDEITRRQPGNAEAWFRLGYSWHSVGKLYWAIPAHRRAAEFDGPRRPVALYNLGCAYALGARYAEAYAALEDAKRAGFENMGAQIDADSDLEGLRADARYAGWRERLAGFVAGGPPLAPLDFLLGEWDEIGADGQLVVERDLDHALGGQVIVDRYRAPSGAEGLGMIFYSAADQTFRRVEVSDNGGVIEMSGRSDGQGVTFEGHWTRADGARVRQRTTVRPAQNGQLTKVTQRSDDGQTWSRVQQVNYVPRSAQRRPDEGAKKPDPRFEWRR